MAGFMDFLTGGSANGLSLPEILGTVLEGAGQADAARGGWLYGPLGGAVAGFGALGPALAQRQRDTHQAAQLAEWAKGVPEFAPYAPMLASGSASIKDVAELVNARKQKELRPTPFEEYQKNPTGYSQFAATLHPQKPEKQTPFDLYKTDPSAFASYERAAHPEKPEKPREAIWGPDAGGMSYVVNLDTMEKRPLGMPAPKVSGGKTAKTDYEKAVVDEYQKTHPSASVADAVDYYRKLGKNPKTDWEMASVNEYLRTHVGATVDQAIKNYRALSEKAGSPRIIRGGDGRSYKLSEDGLSATPIDGVPGKGASPIPLRRGADGRYYLVDQKTRAGTLISGMPASALKGTKPTGFPRGFTASPSPDVPGAYLLTPNPGITKIPDSGGILGMGGTAATPMLFIPPGRYIKPGEEISPGVFWKP